MFCFPTILSEGFLQYRFLAGRTAKNKKKLEESGKTAVESIDNVRTVVSLGIEETFITQYKNLLQYPFELVCGTITSNKTFHCSLFPLSLSSLSPIHSFFFHRSNTRGVLYISLVFAIAQSLTYVFYAAGYVVSIFLVVEERNNYSEIFRSAVTAVNVVVPILLIFLPSVTA